MYVVMWCTLTILPAIVQSSINNMGLDCQVGELVIRYALYRKAQARFEVAFHSTRSLEGENGGMQARIVSVSK